MALAAASSNRLVTQPRSAPEPQQEPAPFGRYLGQVFFLPDLAIAPAAGASTSQSPIVTIMDVT